MAGGPVDEGLAAKAAGAAVLSGIAWSIYKSAAAAAPKSISIIRVSPLHSSSSAAAAAAFQISKGDTLFSISQRYGVSVDALRVANGIDGDTIYAGETLVIPN